MKTFTILLAAMLLCTFLPAQGRIWQSDVVAENVQLRLPEAVTLGTVTVDIPAPGKVYARFDGDCISSVSDRITLAVSNFDDWVVNDGNTWVQAYDSLHWHNCFFHTRVFDVTPGTQTFYAIGQNWVNQIGTGIASVYGKLTIEFVPDEGSEDLAGTGIIDGPRLWGTEPFTLDTISVLASGPGQILVNLEGHIYLRPNDSAEVTTNMAETWPHHPEIEPIIMSENHGAMNFAHRKIYDVSSAGEYQFYALCRQTGGDFTVKDDWTYGTFSAHFVPDDSGDSWTLASSYVSDVDMIDGAQQEIAQVQIDVPLAGMVSLQFTGLNTASFDDKIVYTLFATSAPDSPLGRVRVQPNVDGNPNTFFSNSAVVSVEPGMNTFRMVADFDTSSFGSGLAQVTGLFTAQFAQHTVSTAVREAPDIQEQMTFFPNPTSGLFYAKPVVSKTELKEYDMTLMDAAGSVLSNKQSLQTDQLAGDLSFLPDGVYYIRLHDGTICTTHQIVKASIH